MLSRSVLFEVCFSLFALYVCLFVYLFSSVYLFSFAVSWLCNVSGRHIVYLRN